MKLRATEGDSCLLKGERMGQEETNLTKNALKVLEKRYLLTDGSGNVVESPDDLFWRVARTIAAIDLRYSKKKSLEKRAATYYDMMSSLKFLPNSPTLMNAGTPSGQLSACFVIPVGDSIQEIFHAVSVMAVIHKTGGGTGFSFSRLRPKNDIVGSTGGIASGPVSFMKIFDQATEVVKQGGRRRGANMGILRVDHPDIMEFIEAKRIEGEFRNFNLSVAVTDEFMGVLQEDGTYPLINPRNGEMQGRLSARDVWSKITEMAWSTGDPGVVFIDKINSLHPIRHMGTIEATNPCGEQPLLPYESCNLGSINLARLVRDGALDWDELKRLVKESVRFLDGVIDANRYPLDRIRDMTLANRKIGLGVMGFAEMLIQLGIPYDSEEAVAQAEMVMRTLSEEAVQVSRQLGEERGNFPHFKGSLWDQKGLKNMRNATVTTIAPTGTISIIADASSGIEPLFAVAYMRRALEGSELLEVNRYFLDQAKEQGFAGEEVFRKIVQGGSVRDMPGIPETVRRLFVTAFDIDPSWHVRMQAAFQRYTDNAVSKTVNLQSNATVEDVDNLYRKAYELGCKGITVFRFGSRKESVLSMVDNPAMLVDQGMLKVDDDYSGECKICSV